MRRHHCRSALWTARYYYLFTHSEHVCAVLRQLNDNFNRAMHKQNTRRMAFKKNLGARAPHKNHAESVSRCCLPFMPAVYILLLFEIYDDVWLFLSLLFNKTSLWWNGARITRTMRWKKERKRNGQREEAAWPRCKLYKVKEQTPKALCYHVKNRTKTF